MNYSRAHQLFSYDSLTGELTRKVSCGPCKAGVKAGCHDGRDGYTRLKADGKSYQAHRVAWLMVYGSWPDHEIDHIDGNRSNNAIKNLRDVTRQGNMRNKCLQRNNYSGCNGVQLHKRDNKWQAYITVNRKQIHLGCYADREEAVAKRKMAEVIYGFHANHGRVTV